MKNRTTSFCPPLFKLIFYIFTFILFSCNQSGTATKTGITNDSLTEKQKHLPENALKGLKIYEGLEVHAFATEPMLKNPTNIDIDERGRVWVCEAYNYRPAVNGNPTNPLGDRIMILQDNDGDGKADTSKIFYQGPELNSPLGICVLGNKVIISQSPNVWVFYDDNGDDKADRKELLFSGIGGIQHDHGIHAFTFGPDGKLYFNMGNEGHTLKDKDGKDVLDQDGDVIGPKKYKQAMVFRCDTDGSHVECLGSNFRNPYEVAVDSYGTMWQSDNDDDGNRGTRINYVMQYGNYGYTDEMTGAGWGVNRTNVEDSIPLKHWHLNDPGEVPNILQTGAGSPTGMVIYEGSLLPEQFHNQMIHADAGPNVVRSYPVKNSGAGFDAQTLNILKSEKDQWFRPADAGIAPDGSLIVADWYDPGVGGHAAGDQTRGRIYRVAPPASKYKIVKEDYSTATGAIKALQNPNLSTRYHAYTTLQQMGVAAIPALENFWTTTKNPRMAARAFWVLVKIKGANAGRYIQEAISQPNPDLRITAIRAAVELNDDIIGIVRALAHDTSAQVRRECALALHHNKSPEAAELWTVLATLHDGKDRWYLEALGIGADKQWDNFFTAYLKKVPDPLKTEASKDIVWRARTEIAVPYLAILAADSKQPIANRLRYFRAFDFNPGPAKAKLLLSMLAQNKDIIVNKLVLRALDIKTVNQSAIALQALNNVLKSISKTEEYIELVTRYEVKSQIKNLLQVALTKADKSLGKAAADLLFRLGGTNEILKIIKGNDTLQQNNILTAIGGVGSKVSIDMLQNIALSTTYKMPLRIQAANKIGHSGSGENRVLEILKNKKVPKALIPAVVASVRGAWRMAVRTEAASYLPGNNKPITSKPDPTMPQLLALKENAVDGEKIFSITCTVCHQVNNTGYDFGPKLSEIGTKLPKDGLLDAIIHPSAGIGFGYDGWQVKLKDGSLLSGIIASKTTSEIDLKFPGGSHKLLKTSEVKSLTKIKESMMPEGLSANMSTQDMANLIGYLEGLKKK